MTGIATVQRRGLEGRRRNHLSDGRLLGLEDRFGRHLDSLLERADLDPVLSLPDEELALAGNGAHEIRSWLTVAGAVFPAKARVLAYEPIAPWITGMGAVVFEPA